MSLRIALIDNRDSFVYNLLDALGDHDCRVFRNTVPMEAIDAARPELIVLSPGPGHPRAAGNLMDLVARYAGRTPLVGICLGFQAMIEHFGGQVRPCGPVHGQSSALQLIGDPPLFAGLSPQVARYHSLGATDTPGMTPLATVATDIGDVIMAAQAPGMVGLQFHPESLLTPAGPLLLQRILTHLTDPTDPGDLR